MHGLLNVTAAPLGRLLLSAIFLMSGVHKVFNWEATAQRMASEGMLYVNLLLAGAVAFELLGGLSLLFGCGARQGALALLVFLVPTTLIFHDFWTYEGQEQQAQMIHFMKNLAIMGGLLVVVGRGGGGWCLTGRKQQDDA